ncbi:MAG: hypothetical protein BGO66_07345 [Alicycliphilus sp. 69-12]|nr:MAG: hypothetical protein BGO66_07345 [Alicycliphilus sp. 69-12]
MIHLRLSMAACGRCVNSLWSMAMSHSCPGESVARSVPGSRATAPFSATMASTGQAAANGSLQPTGRPVMGMTCRPAALRSASAASASGVIAPSVVSVSSMSVRMPTIWVQDSRGQ